MNLPKLLFWQRLRDWGRMLKNDIIVLYLVMKHPATPLAVKALAALVVGYALSPIDLIPDFIPVLGYLDDLVILPVGILIVTRLVPKPILQSCRMEAEHRINRLKPKLWFGAVLIALLWLLILYKSWMWIQ